MDITIPTSIDAAGTIWPAGYHALDVVNEIETDGARVRMRVDTSTVEVTALTATIFRVGFFPQGRRVNYHSAAVPSTKWAEEPVTIFRREGELGLGTLEATAYIGLNPLRIGFGDQQGRSFATDDPELGMGWLEPSALLATINHPNPLDTVGAPVRVYKKHTAGEHYFGCGERIGGLDKTGTYQLFWNVDPPPGRTALQSNLYVTIPFTVVLDNGLAWGIFVDNPALSEFDLAREDQERAWFGAACGDLIYYVFCGPTPQDVLAQYTQVTGRTPLPPMWGLGNGQSRFSYGTAEEVLTIARTFRERDIPCDTIYLDIDYMRGFRNFTWDHRAFPDPAALLAELREQGFHVVTIVDAGVKVDETYAVYTEGRDRHLFCKNARGEDYLNTVWPGICAFPDFLSARARSWWGEQHRVLLDDGIAGIWCDMNEPALFTPSNSTMPADVLHTDVDGEMRFHIQVHNAYGSFMAQATREGLLALQPEQRPFVITRSGYAGVQRSSIVWTGDNLATWDKLAMSIAQLQNLGLSGVAWSGVDIGGFYEDSTGELVTRWTEFGIFQAFCRNHAEKLTRPQEPWAFGEPYESACRAMLKLRQRLLPYLYTLFDECHRSGAPLLRPLFWATPADTTTYAIDDEFLCGDTLLVAPITRPGIEYRHVYLPEGTWFHYWTGERIEGPQHTLVRAPLGQPAVYIRANTALPLYAEMSYVGERFGDPLTLIVYSAIGRGETLLYEDAGDGFEYEQGVFARRAIRCEVEADHITIELDQQEGRFVPAREQVILEVRAVPVSPVRVTLDDEEVSWQYDQELHALSLEIPASASAQTLDIFTV